MKKFINDNLWWMLVIALVLGGYAAYKIYKAEHPTGEANGATE